MPGRLHDLFIRYREMIHGMSAGQHDRAPEAVACILIGYAMMLNYFRDVEAIDNDTASKMLAHAMKVLTEASRKQAKDMESEKPTRIFLDSMSELLASKTVVLKDISGGMDPEATKDPSPLKDMVGYMDADYYYLLPAVAFGAVQKLCREQGIEFPVSLKALYKHLRTDGVLKGMQSSENPTKNKWIDGRAVRLLWIPREAMDGPKASAEQVKMGFTQADPDELPQEWK